MSKIFEKGCIDALHQLGVLIAAGILYPWTGVLLNPMIAALAMSFSSLSVILNSLRLRHLKLLNLFK